MLHRRICLAVTVTCLCWTSVASARIWTSKNGQTMDGIFIRQEGNQVTIFNKATQQEETYPISVFSTVDQRYIVKQKDNPDPPETIPDYPRPSENPVNPNIPGNQANFDLEFNGEYRTWTTAAGIQFTARFKSAKGALITLERPDDQLVPIQYAALSRGDQEYLMNLATTRTTPENPNPTPPISTPNTNPNPMTENPGTSTSVNNTPTTTVPQETVPVTSTPSQPQPTSENPPEKTQTVKERKRGGPLQFGTDSVIRESTPPRVSTTPTNTPVASSGSGSTFLGILIVLVLVGALAGASRFSRG